MTATRRSRAVDDAPVAAHIGRRIRRARESAGLTQAQLAGERYSKTYISALETGHVKPSIAALYYLAPRLGLTVDGLLSESETAWVRLEADLRLAAGDWQAAVDGYEALLERASGGERAELLRGLAEASARLDRGETAVRAATEAVALFDAADRKLDAAWARYWQAFGFYQLEQSASARRILHGIVDGFEREQVGDAELHVRALIALGMVESRDDQPEDALAHLEAARALVDGLDDRRRASFYFSLALSYREVGDFEGAIKAGHLALGLFRAAAAEFDVASLENELALVYLGLDQRDRARTAALAARRSFELAGNKRWLAHVSETQAQIELAGGEDDLALAFAREAIAFAEETENRKALISGLLTLSRALRSIGEADESVSVLERAADVARSYGRRAQLQTVLGELGVALAEQGELRRAFEVSQEALSVGRPHQRHQP